MTVKISEKIRNRILEYSENASVVNDMLSNLKDNSVKLQLEEGECRYYSEAVEIADKEFGDAISIPPRCHSNDNISEFIEDGELDLLVDEVAENMQGVLDALVIDTINDHNTKETARRVAKMMVLETFNGRYVSEPTVTSFPNDKQYDQIYVVGPISIRSTCAHHLQNITGKCWIGVKPGKEVIGLSKFNRLVRWIVRRPTIQEEMTEQIADKIEEITDAEGVAVFIRAEHACMTHRGVMEHDSDMKTSVMRGLFLEDASAKKEFFDMVKL